MSHVSLSESAYDIPTLPGIKKEKITTKRITTRVLQSGPDGGVPVLFIHGITCGATFWEETMLSLPAGYRGIALDLRGHAGADPNVIVDATRGVGDQVDDAFALLDYFNIQRAHIVGHSYGGLIVLNMVRKHPERVISVTTVTPSPPYGFGTKDEKGTLINNENSGTGVLQLPALLHQSITKGDKVGARAVINLIWSAPFHPKREEEFLSTFLSTHHDGDRTMPGDTVPSSFWPFSSAGKFGSLNSMAASYPLGWGKDDLIIAERTSAIDAATQGAAGALPDYPGSEVYPGTPCISQTRALLEEYKNDGGSYVELAYQCGHLPYLEKEEEFNKDFHSFLQYAK